MSALVCLSREGGRSDRAAPLSALASGSLAATAVCSTRERAAESEAGEIKGRQRGRRGMEDKPKEGREVVKQQKLQKETMGNERRQRGKKR